MNVLLSIKPKYVEEIKKGNKRYEFRKTPFCRKNLRKIKKIYIYSSSPVKRIVGVFFSEVILEEHPKKLWEKCRKYSGINKKDYFDYFKEKKRGIALEIKNLKIFDIPMDPKTLIPNFNPPQSFCYIEDLEKNDKITKYMSN